MKQAQTGQSGMTLIELLISIAIFSIIIILVISSKSTQQEQSVSQIQAVEMQQSVRAVMLAMKQQLRSAGYNPLDDDFGEGITAAGATSISFSYVSADDGSLTSVVYTFTDQDGDGDGDITANINGAGADIMAENIQNLTLSYFDENGNALISPVVSPADIRSMQISITSAVDANQIAWGANNTRTLTSIVYLRNMGL